MQWNTVPFKMTDTWTKHIYGEFKQKIRKQGTLSEHNHIKPMPVHDDKGSEFCKFLVLCGKVIYILIFGLLQYNDC